MSKIPLRTNSPQPGTSFDSEAIKMRAFTEWGMIVVNIDDSRLSWVDKEELRRIGAKLYGRKPKAA